MEIRHRILQFMNSPAFDLLKSELQKLGCAYQFNENRSLSSIEYTFSEHERFAPSLLEFATVHSIPVQSVLYYREDEIMQAEWVIGGVGEFQYPQPEDNYIEATYDTRDYCSRCGQGNKQDRPFRLKKDFTQKQAKFLGLHWVFDEIFIRPEIKGLFDSADISGIKYRDVIHHRTGQRINNVLQMDIPVMEEQGLIIDNLFSVTCKKQNEEAFIKGLGQLEASPGLPFCGRIKYHYPLTEPIKFKAGMFKDLPDIVKSYEYYGSGAAANRFLLFRSKVVRLIKEKGLSGLEFRRPVHLV